MSRRQLSLKFGSSDESTTLKVMGRQVILENRRLAEIIQTENVEKARKLTRREPGEC